jgi:1-acyl-sn-glycerol-3-phosphate acyltransferase
MAAFAAQESTPWVFFRSIILNILFGITTAVFLVPILTMGLLRRQHALHWFGRLWTKACVFITGSKVEFENLDKLYRDGPVIILCNHQSNFDVLALASAIDLQLRFMAKASLFRIPFFGWALSGGGHIPVERDDRRKAQASLFAAAERIKNGTSVFVFPEGTRGNPDGTMLPFKKGGFVLAKKAGVVLQPVTIWGSHRILPADERYKMPRIFPGTVRGIVHDPIHPEEYKKLSLDALSEKIYAIVERPLERMSQVGAVLD